MTAPARWTPNPAAAAAKLQAVHARLTAAVAELTRGEAWQQLLQTAARLPVLQTWRSRDVRTP